MRRYGFVLSLMLCVVAPSWGDSFHSESVQSEFNLPAQPLLQAIQAIARQTDTNIVVDPRLVYGRWAPALKAHLTMQEAITKLLAGTRLTQRVVDENTIAITEEQGGNGQVASGDGGGQGGAWRTADSKTSSRSQAEGTGDVTPSPATGEGTPKGADEEKKESSISEIIVTAQKRGEERLQDVPIPITALSADALTETNQLRLEDYYTKVPGLNATLFGDGATPLIAIRGITTGGFTIPTVGVVVDDIPFGSSNFWSAPDIDPTDLERVEVLRGPQGTLYGASSLGGLIKYVTKQPSPERFGSQVVIGTGGVSHGDDIGYSLRGSINIPLGDTLAVRASGFTRRDPGYIDNLRTGEKDVNERESAGGRLAMLWRPSDAISITLTGMTQQAKQNGASTVLPELGDLKQDALIDTGKYDRKNSAYSATINLMFNRAELTLLSGYSKNNLYIFVDDTPATFFEPLVLARYGVTGSATENEQKNTNFSQEVRLSMPLGERIDWMLGGFYTHERSSGPYRIYAIDSTTGGIAGTWLEGANNATVNRIEEYAAFTDLTFKITDRFDIQLGGRQSRVKTKVSDGGSSGPFNTEVLGAPTDSLLSEGSSLKADDPFTFLVTPRFRLSEDLMTYGRVASGYRRGGGGPARDSSPCVILNFPCQYKADKTLNYELGLKGSVFGNSLAFDGSIYYIDWKDFPVQTQDTNTTLQYTSNGGRAKSQGVEISIEARPINGLTVAGWVAWNEAELKEALPVQTGYGLSGDRLPYSSRFSGSLTLGQAFPLPGGLSGHVGGTVSFVGDRVGKFTFAPARADLPSYFQVDLIGGVMIDDWKVEAFITNLTDKRGLLRGELDAPFQSLYPVVNYTQPRTFGFSVARSF